MNRSKVAGIVLAGALIFFAPRIASAESIVDGDTFTVTATVLSTGSLNTAAKLIGTNVIQSSVSFAPIAGAGQAAWSKLTDQYIAISVNDNAIAWRVRAFTNNFSTFTSAISTTTWGIAYGGLIGNAAPGGAKVAMAWRNSPVLLSTGPSTGNPANGVTTGWTYFKDNHDLDDPLAGGDQSFVGSDAAGFTNIAFGSPTFTRIVVPESGTGSITLASLSTPWNFYMEGDFSAAPASSYTTNLVFELLDQ